MDYQNCSDFEDYHTVIFGHNLHLGMMFSDLQKIVENKLGKDIYINIYLPERVKQYKVFSSYVSDPVKDPIDINITDPKAFIKEQIQKSQIDFNTMPNEEDNILTLSTCDNTGKKRIIIHAVKILEKNN